jgi:hypothetical protein
VSRRIGLRAFALAVWLAAGAGVCAAQTVSSATVTGTVRDASEAVVPGANVQLINEAMNHSWEATTDVRGRFAILYVPLGEYRLSVRLPGFADATKALTLGVGDRLDLHIDLKPAAVAESVDVEANSPLVEGRRTESASAVTPAEVDALPLNGRNYLDLATLAPNVSRTNLRTTDRFAETSAVPGTGVSISGQRNLNNNFIVDGLSANDDAADLAGTFFSEEVIREFQVVTSGGGAEFGRASSGTISVVTQSGTNTFRGRGYEFFRDSAFDARSPLSNRKDAVTGALLKDPLRQNQFGLSLGGPLTKDRRFWFANVERTALDRTGVITIAPLTVALVNATLDATRYPGPRIATGDFPTGFDTTNVFGRVDQQAAAGARLEARYNLYRVTSRNARNVGGLNAVSRGTALDDTDQTLAINLLTPVSSGAIHEVRGQFTRSRLGAPVNDLVGPAVNIAGAATFGTATFSPTARRLDVYEAVDTLTLQRGTHLFKTGIDVLYNRVTIDFPGALQGVYSFTSLTDFQRGVYSQFQQAFGAPSQFQSNPNLGLFAQDEWQPHAHVTVTAGLRYDLQWLPDPIHLDANNVSPRAGIAYAPGDGRTVLRASGGVYFDRLPLRATSNALQRDGTKYKTAVLSAGQPGTPVFPGTLPAFPAAVLVSITTIDPDVQAARSEQAGVELERAVGSHLIATVGYNYARGHGLVMSHNVNVPTLTVAQAAALGVPNLGRPNPDFGNIGQTDSLGDAWFNGLTVSLASRGARWGRTRVSYTLSRALDDAGNAFFQTPQDNFDILADKGPSDNDQRHRLVVSGTIGDSTSRALRRALAGLQIGYVFSYATAAPFNPQAGADLNNDTNQNDRPAGMTRNSFRLPCFSHPSSVCGTSSFDLRVSRPIAVWGGRMDLMAEAFNLFNRVNVVNVNNNYGTGAARSVTFRQVMAIGDMRQIQLGVRCTF